MTPPELVVDSFAGPREPEDLSPGACGHLGCDCPDGVFYETEEHSDADPGI